MAQSISTLIDQLECGAAGTVWHCSETASGRSTPIYSLRHFYAVQGVAKGVGALFEVARNMGTSVEIIQEYYGKQANSGHVCNKAGRLAQQIAGYSAVSIGVKVCSKFGWAT